MTQENPGHSEEAPGHNKSYSIIVNGRPRTISVKKLTYIEAVHLVYPNEQPSDLIAFTVTYSNPHGQDGSLVDGQEVNVHEGMILNVRKTDRS